MPNTFLYYCDRLRADWTHGYASGVVPVKIESDAKLLARRAKCDAVAIIAFGREIAYFELAG